MTAEKLLVTFRDMYERFYWKNFTPDNRNQTLYGSKEISIDNREKLWFFSDGDHEADMYTGQTKRKYRAGGIAQTTKADRTSDRKILRDVSEKNELLCRKIIGYMIFLCHLETK